MDLDFPVSSGLGEFSNRRGEKMAMRALICFGPIRFSLLSCASDAADNDRAAARQDAESFPVRMRIDDPETLRTTYDYFAQGFLFRRGSVWKACAAH